ncbi:MAG: ornithine carbamoyltransferase [Chloroflexi bacterium]|nr:ornithine carbamoyltransferase [Chloroflexota bacterium]|tara:strand:- start:578 stop:1492 length:915 start_codon:yes stop_codon:yes gene_type:complete
MNSKDFLSIIDISRENIYELVDKTNKMKSGWMPDSLNNKILALLFEKPSLRTRVSFEVGISQMGGKCIYLSKDDVGLGIREPESDIAKVLDRWVDGIVARVFSHNSLDLLANNTSIPVINALSDFEHPCQALGDLATISQHKGSFEGLNVVFIGDGNNVASSLALVCASVGVNFTLSSPVDYKLPAIILNEVESRAAISGSKVKWVLNPSEAVINADFVYTDVWVSMGQENDRKERLKDFTGYTVTEDLLNLAKPSVLFMHDMPAHRGEEIDQNVLDSSRSIAFDQAENRLYAQKAIMHSLFSK